MRFPLLLLLLLPGCFYDLGAVPRPEGSAQDGSAAESDRSMMDAANEAFDAPGADVSPSDLPPIETPTTETPTADLPFEPTADTGPDACSPPPGGICDEVTNAGCSSSEFCMPVCCKMSCAATSDCLRGYTKDPASGITDCHRFCRADLECVSTGQKCLGLLKCGGAVVAKYCL